MIGINKVCGDVVNQLRLTGKQVFSANDIQQALREAGRGGSSFTNYMGTDGHLAKRGYLHRRLGGWELSESSMTNDVISIRVMPANPALVRDVFDDVRKATERYGRIVKIEPIGNSEENIDHFDRRTIL